MSPKLLKKQAARQEREARKGVKKQPTPFIAPVSMYVPQELQPLHAAVLKWVSTKFSTYDTFKDGIDGLREDYGMGFGIAVGLAQLFVSLGVKSQAELLSLSDFSIDSAEGFKPKAVTIKEAVDAMVKSIETYGMEEVVHSCTNYRCYEDWETVFNIASNLYEGVTKERFGMLVKFLYDGYSQQ